MRHPLIGLLVGELLPNRMKTRYALRAREDKPRVKSKSSFVEALISPPSAAAWSPWLRSWVASRIYSSRDFSAVMMS